MVFPPDSKNVLVDLVELEDRFREGGDRGNRSVQVCTGRTAF